MIEDYGGKWQLGLPGLRKYYGPGEVLQGKIFGYNLGNVCFETIEMHFTCMEHY
jgi:hypothetical protein